VNARLRIIAAAAKVARKRLVRTFCSALQRRFNELNQKGLGLPVTGDLEGEF